MDSDVTAVNVRPTSDSFLSCGSQTAFQKQKQIRPEVIVNASLDLECSEMGNSQDRESSECSETGNSQDTESSESSQMGNPQDGKKCKVQSLDKDEYPGLDMECVAIDTDSCDALEEWESASGNHSEKNKQANYSSCISKKNSVFSPNQQKSVQCEMQECGLLSVRDKTDDPAQVRQKISLLDDKVTVPPKICEMFVKRCGKSIKIINHKSQRQMVSLLSSLCFKNKNTQHSVDRLKIVTVQHNDSASGTGLLQHIKQSKNSSESGKTVSRSFVPNSSSTVLYIVPKSSEDTVNQNSLISVMPSKTTNSSEPVSKGLSDGALNVKCVRAGPGPLNGGKSSFSNFTSVSVGDLHNSNSVRAVQSAHNEPSADQNSHTCSQSAHTESSADQNSHTCSQNAHNESSADQNSDTFSQSVNNESSADQNSDTFSQSANNGSSADKNSRTCSQSPYNESSVHHNSRSCSDTQASKTVIAVLDSGKQQDGPYRECSRIECDDDGRMFYVRQGKRTFLNVRRQDLSVKSKILITNLHHRIQALELCLKYCPESDRKRLSRFITQERSGTKALEMLMNKCKNDFQCVMDVSSDDKKVGSKRSERGLTVSKDKNYTETLNTDIYTHQNINEPQKTDASLHENDNGHDNSEKTVNFDNVSFVNFEQDEDKDDDCLSLKIESVFSLSDTSVFVENEQKSCNKESPSQLSGDSRDGAQVTVSSDSSDVSTGSQNSGKKSVNKNSNEAVQESESRTKLRSGSSSNTKCKRSRSSSVLEQCYVMLERVVPKQVEKALKGQFESRCSPSCRSITLQFMCRLGMTGCGGRGKSRRIKPYSVFLDHSYALPSTLVQKRKRPAAGECSSSNVKVTKYIHDLNDVNVDEDDGCKKLTKRYIIGPKNRVKLVGSKSKTADQEVRKVLKFTKVDQSNVLGCCVSPVSSTSSSSAGKESAEKPDEMDHTYFTKPADSAEPGQDASSVHNGQSEANSVQLKNSTDQGTSCDESTLQKQQTSTLKEASCQAYIEPKNTSVKNKKLNEGSEKELNVEKAHNEATERNPTTLSRNVKDNTVSTANPVKDSSKPESEIGPENRSVSNADKQDTREMEDNSASDINRTTPQSTTDHCPPESLSGGPKSSNKHKYVSLLKKNENVTKTGPVINLPPSFPKVDGGIEIVLDDTSSNSKSSPKTKLDPSKRFALCVLYNKSYLVPLSDNDSLGLPGCTSIVNRLVKYVAQKNKTAGPTPVLTPSTSSLHGGVSSTVTSSSADTRLQKTISRSSKSSSTISLPTSSVQCSVVQTEMSDSESSSSASLQNSSHTVTERNIHQNKYDNSGDRRGFTSASHQSRTSSYMEASPDNSSLSSSVVIKQEPLDDEYYEESMEQDAASVQPMEQEATHIQPMEQEAASLQRVQEKTFNSEQTEEDVFDNVSEDVCVFEDPAEYEQTADNDITVKTTKEDENGRWQQIWCSDVMPADDPEPESHSDAATEIHSGKSATAATTPTGRSLFEKMYTEFNTMHSPTTTNDSEDSVQARSQIKNAFSSRLRSKTAKQHQSDRAGSVTPDPREEQQTTESDEDESTTQNVSDHREGQQTSDAEDTLVNNERFSGGDSQNSVGVELDRLTEQEKRIQQLKELLRQKEDELKKFRERPRTSF